MKKKFSNDYGFMLRDEFLKNYVIAIGIAIVVDWLMIPYFTKLMGQYVLVAFITIYYIVSELAGYIEPSLEKFKISTIFGFLIVLDTIQFLCLGLFFIDEKIFVYSLMCVFASQAILYEIYTIKTTYFFEKYKKNISITKLQKLLLFNRTNMIFVGLFLSLIYSLFTENYVYLILFIMMLMCISISREIKLYKYVKSVEN